MTPTRLDQASNRLWGHLASRVIVDLPLRRSVRVLLRTVVVTCPRQAGRPYRRRIVQKRGVRTNILVVGKRPAFESGFLRRRRYSRHTPTHRDAPDCATPRVRFEQSGVIDVLLHQQQNPRHKHRARCVGHRDPVFVVHLSRVLTARYNTHAIPWSAATCWRFCIFTKAVTGHRTPGRRSHQATTL